MANFYQPGGYGLTIEDIVNDPDLMDALGMSQMADFNAPGPQGIHAGGTYVGPHPLQGLAHIGERIAGGLNWRRMNQALARTLRNKYGGGTGEADVPSTWGYGSADFSPGGSHEGWS